MPQATKLKPNKVLLKSDKSIPLNLSWFDPEFWKSQHSLIGTGNGRGAVWFIENELGRFVIRRYRRGGLIAKFNKNHFLFTGQTNTRPWLELHLLEHMHNIGLPVPKPIGGYYQIEKGFYQAALLTETIEGAQDLFDIIKAGKSDTVNWQELGEVIRNFHTNDIYHSDLNCHNIMIDKQNKIWVIDFDKCEQRTANPTWMQSNIDRLKRSLDKESNKYDNFAVSETQWHAFLEGYNG